MDLSVQTYIPTIPDAMVRGYITLEIMDTPLKMALSLILSPMTIKMFRVPDIVHHLPDFRQ